MSAFDPAIVLLSDRATTLIAASFVGLLASLMNHRTVIDLFKSNTN